MSIGQRRAVMIEPYSSVKNSNGAWIESPGNRVQCWAEVTDPSGFRVYQNGQTQLGETKNFLIRYRFDRFPNCDWRLIYDGRIWTVSEIRRTDEKRFYYRLTATSKKDV